MAVYTLINDYYGHGFKVGSTWSFLYTRKAGTPPVAVDVSGLTSRVMFREGSEDGTVVKTVEDTDITNGGVEGTIRFDVSATDSATFKPKTWYYHDVEMTSPSGFVWQSPTIRFRTEQEITR